MDQLYYSLKQFRSEANALKQGFTNCFGKRFHSLHYLARRELHMLASVFTYLHLMRTVNRKSMN